MFEKLTKRQKEVVQLLVEGHGNRDIAKKLFITEKTVKNHLFIIYEKLNVERRSQVVAMYYKGKIKILESEIHRLRGEKNGSIDG